MLSVYALRRLRSCAPPGILFAILQTIASQSLASLSQDYLSFVEYFCGIGWITKVFQSAGFPAMGYDIEERRTANDMNSPEGFIWALILV